MRILRCIFSVTLVSLYHVSSTSQRVTLGRWVFSSDDTEVTNHSRQTTQQQHPVEDAIQSPFRETTTQSKRRRFLPSLQRMCASSHNNNQRNHVNRNRLLTTSAVILKGGHQSSHSPSSSESFWCAPLFVRMVQSKRKKRRASTVPKAATIHSQTAETTSPQFDNRILESIVNPIIDSDVWNQLTGREFSEHPDSIDQLATMGERLARDDQSNDWVRWKPHGDHEDLQQGHIHVWTGQAQRDGQGSKNPWIKTRAVIPFTPEEFKELLLDSDRVKTYNPWSLGRDDCWTLNENTKIVKNRTQPPVGSKAMVSVTLLHARPVAEPNGWVVISRAIGGKLYMTEADEELNRSDVLLGVNLLQPLDDDSSLLTAIAHVDCSAVPSMLAVSLGVKGATKFIKDMRKVKVPA